MDCTITCGNAFGGDLETVNLYTALIAAKLIRKCNGAVIIMGPGHVGTHTKLGFTGVELANNAHTIYSMGGTPICIPRVSFSEKRNRHYGISHHFLTTMGQHCLIPCHMAFANYAYNEKEYIMGQYEKYNLGKKHIIHFVEEDTISVMERYDLSIKTMGRTIREDPEFFRTAGACGMLMTGFLV
ncbi:MAG: DUF3866 family protein [Epulopiscium sp.]|nr:DUF3866 family protein [Candidatus Epulonipiscium sp.]